MKIRICRRCGAQVQRSEVEGYSYYCPEHDEDLFDFETEILDTKELDRKLISLHQELMCAWALARDAAYDHYSCEPNSDEAVKTLEAIEKCLNHLKEIWYFGYFDTEKEN